MKITGIEIGEYRQFKNIKFDFTYPADHAKAGQPLEKVCFIGQSGTGKTTLLNVIWDYLSIVEDGYLINRNSNPIKDSDKHYSTFENSISIDSLLLNQVIHFDKAYFPEGYDRSDPMNPVFGGFKLIQEYNFYEYLKSQPKLGLYLDDSSSSQAYYLTVNRHDNSLDDRPFIASTDDIGSSRLQDQLTPFDFLKTLKISEKEGDYLWSSLLRDIQTYDKQLLKIASSLIQDRKSFSHNRLLSALNEWEEANPNPKIDLAKKCLNPILKKFFLEVDTAGTEALIVIKTKSGESLRYNGLSTGTRQILATAIPIYKFDTTDTVILFDEPERSLFPDIQRDLVQYYTGLAPTAQFFFATHSPIIAAAFEPCERFILDFNENGEVVRRKGVAPIGDDPNDILRKDFGMSPLVNNDGVEAYKTYLDLTTEARNEPDINRRMEILAKRAVIGNEHNFPPATNETK